jgi:PAS domain S-box-containing protein
MLNFLLLMVDVWLLAGLAMLLHRLSPHYGFAPLLIFIGALIFPIQNQLGVYVEPFPGLLMFFSSSVLIPVILFAILILYIANGAMLARVTIFSITGITLLILTLILLYRLHLSLPDGGNINGLPADTLIRPVNPRLTFASILTLLVDMFVIAIVYQGARNLRHKLPEWLIIGLALIASLWTDAVLFGLLADLGTPNFTAQLPGDILGKTISGLILWPPAAFYLTRIAPSMPDYLGAKNRPMLDIFYGTFKEMRWVLTHTQAALKEAESKNRQEGEYFQQIADNIDEGLWLVTPDQSRAVYVNRAYERIWGYPAQTIYSDGMLFLKSLHPDDRDRMLNLILRQREGQYQAEFRIIRPDGEVRWIRDVSFPIRDENGTLLRIAGISHDVTEHKLNEKQQLELQLEREKVKVLYDFISDASHDLKSPLAAILLKAQIIAKLQDVEKQHIHALELQQICRRMEQMIDDLMTLARLENLHELQQTELDLRGILQEILVSVQPIIDHKQLQISLALADASPVMQVAPNNLTRALANLIDNAIHYTPSGGNIHIESHSDERETIIRVSDSGIGIAPEEQAHVFERFFRAANARKTNPSGSGLGLAIVHKIIEQHYGRIEMQSELGKGTTFTIYLPCTPPVDN